MYVCLLHPRPPTFPPSLIATGQRWVTRPRTMLEPRGKQEPPSGLYATYRLHTGRTPGSATQWEATTSTPGRWKSTHRSVETRAAGISASGRILFKRDGWKMSCDNTSFLSVDPFSWTKGASVKHNAGSTDTPSRSTCGPPPLFPLRYASVRRFYNADPAGQWETFGPDVTVRLSEEKYLVMQRAVYKT